MLLSQKQRRYRYDSIVYAPTLTLLTILFILRVLIKAHLSLEHLRNSRDLIVQKFVFILQVLIKAHLSFEHLIFNGFKYSEICSYLRRVLVYFY